MSFAHILNYLHKNNLQFCKESGNKMRKSDFIKILTIGRECQDEFM